MLAAGVLVIVGALFWRARGGMGGQRPWWAVLQNETVGLAMFLPLVAGIGAGTAYVRDRTTGFAALLLARSVSRTRYVLACLVAGWLVVGGSFSAVFAALIAFIRVVGPAEGTVGGPALPAGFPEGPLGIAVASLATFAGGVMLYVAVAVLMASVTRNVYLAVCGPLITHVFLSILAPKPLSPVDLLQLDFRGLTPASVAAFWVTSTTVTVIGSIVLTRRAERIA